MRLAAILKYDSVENKYFSMPKHHNNETLLNQELYHKLCISCNNIFDKKILSTQLGRSLLKDFSGIDKLLESIRKEQIDYLRLFTTPEARRLVRDLSTKNIRESINYYK